MLIAVRKTEDIPKEYRNTAIESLLAYHNLEQEFGEYDKAEMLVAMCMDYRLQLNIPERFAYIIRTGGANIRHNEFNLAYSVAVGGIKQVALIGHNNCAMSGIEERKKLFVGGLVSNGGWTEKDAHDYYNRWAGEFDIGDEANFILDETRWLRGRYPGISVVPMIHMLEENKLYLIEESQLGIL